MVGSNVLLGVTETETETDGVGVSDEVLVGSGVLVGVLVGLGDIS